MYTIQSSDSVKEDAFSFLAYDFLKSRDPSEFPPSELNLKIGCPLMLLRNYDSINGLCNGSVVILKKVHEHSIIVGEKVWEWNYETIFYSQV